MLIEVFNRQAEVFRRMAAYGAVVYDRERYFLLHDPQGDVLYLQAEQFSTRQLAEMYVKQMSYTERRAARFVHVSCADWAEANGAVCEALSDFCKPSKDRRFPAHVVPWIVGYPEAVAKVSLWRRLMQGERIPVTEAGIPLREVFAADEWYELRTQAEADLFMSMLDLHDGRLDTVLYRESSTEPDEVSIILDLRSWQGCRVEYRFTEPTVVHITNGRYDNGRDILSACLYVDADGVFWADEHLKKDEIKRPFHSAITYIRAARVMVRRVD